MPLDSQSQSELRRAQKNVQQLDAQGRALKADRGGGRTALDEAQAQLLRFTEADSSGNLQLDFPEFYAIQPAKVREAFSTAQIREWFDSADADNSGEVRTQRRAKEWR